MPTQGMLSGGWISTPEPYDWCYQSRNFLSSGASDGMSPSHAHESVCFGTEAIEYPDIFHDMESTSRVCGAANHPASYLPQLV
ncbi:unnamed protein product [Phytophthora fragariaefolia]|uniref:Unnamed protein product n=1 Tax=Phytophthora fragariaefolia TaxID=1490495 RepID=A0A9W7D2P6_9STRA|nr:unnamed protein product [Phytophthora fragariaefolia]